MTDHPVAETSVRVAPLDALQGFAVNPVPSAEPATKLHAITGQQYVTVKADAGNSGTVYVGITPNALAGGWPLAKGDTLSLWTSEPLYLFASTTAQVAHVIQGGAAIVPPSVVHD